MAAKSGGKSHTFTSRGRTEPLAGKAVSNFQPMYRAEEKYSPEKTDTWAFPKSYSNFAGEQTASIGKNRTKILWSLGKNGKTPPKEGKSG